MKFPHAVISFSLSAIKILVYLIALPHNSNVQWVWITFYTLLNFGHFFCLQRYFLSEWVFLVLKIQVKRFENNGVWVLGEECVLSSSVSSYIGDESPFSPRSWLRIVLVSLADRFGWFVNASILGEIYHLLLTCSLVQLWHFLTHILLKNVMKYDFSWTTNWSNVDIY